MMKETLVSICSLLNKHEVDYLVIGGVAVIFHGYTRATADLDFWYKPTLKNYHKIIKAFKEYGFDVSELEEAVFDPKKTFLRFPTRGFKTELLPSLAGDLSFSEAKEKAENIELDDQAPLYKQNRSAIHASSTMPGEARSHSPRV